ncbi:uncharacterized protein GGS22DRAFT_194338 [Annulohypoxylon maeteangense]|uniref:uncharacterized protein n=1 Tax=Annulohypoxylon maeteangense TaxID=1927788 RepID=UPI002008DFD6|nr:uncharacterized protein GGS22DRAFT_194338 [Annulohypoxylon maeteangense]KAI0890132.1 hypothetical protein GGS22DRAFT_194338 [Annulohypoxylon maeteangense]
MPLKRAIPEEDLYAKLGVPSTASRDEIRAQYKELAKKWHPDKAGDTEANKAEFRAVQEAWEILGDEASRKAYDDSRANKKPKFAEFVRGTYPEDPFEGSPDSSPQAKKPKKKKMNESGGGGVGGGGGTSASNQFPAWIAGSSITVAIVELNVKLEEVQRELGVAQGKFDACQHDMLAAFEKRTPRSGNLDWRLAMGKAQVGFREFESRVRAMKSMLPLSGQNHCQFSILISFPKDLAKLSAMIVKISFAVLILIQLVEDYAEGRDNESYICQQMEIIGNLGPVV